MGTKFKPRPVVFIPLWYARTAEERTRMLKAGRKAARELAKKEASAQKKGASRKESSRKESSRKSKLKGLATVAPPGVNTSKMTLRMPPALLADVKKASLVRGINKYIVESIEMRMKRGVGR